MLKEKRSPRSHSRSWGGKISRALMGHAVTQKTREKLRQANIGKKFTEEHKKRMSKAQKGKPKLYIRGENHWNWRGGVCPTTSKIRNSLEYKLWRTAVFERDNYTCIWCGAESGMGKAVFLRADHIKPFSLYPELRFAIDNGRTLCEDCHKTTDTYGGKMNGVSQQLR